MTGEGKMEGMHVMTLLWSVSLTLCFNLEPQMHHLYHYPYAATQGRQAYFGYSVALQHSYTDGANWVIVGAPRANSSIHNKKTIEEPGAVFRCTLTHDTCEELNIDNGDEADSNVVKSYGWLGASVDSQPVYRNNRQATCVCAPMSRYKHGRKGKFMNGVCYVATQAISDATFIEDLPLRGEQDSVQGNETIYVYGYGQAGFSVHFPDDATELIVGAPGVHHWNGSVILFEDYKGGGDSDARKKRDVSDANMLVSGTPLKLNISRTDADGLFGYSTTSGRFLPIGGIQYAAGSPRAANSHGKVSIFELQGQDYDIPLSMEQEFKGQQMGEYFGASVAAADINHDGLDDLVVGAPMYSSDTFLPDTGRIHVFLSVQGVGLDPNRSEVVYGKNVSFARFGTSLASPGDLNDDKYEDIVVGAPWEGEGAVYVFLGSSMGLRERYSQRLSRKDFTPNLGGFGMSISRGIDIDGNGYPDLAIGSSLSDHTIVIKSRPVAKLSGQVTANPSKVAWESEETVILTACLKYRGYRNPTNLTVHAILILDSDFRPPRAHFTNKKSRRALIENLTIDVDKCTNYTVTVLKNKMNPDRPIAMKLEYQLTNYPDLELKEAPVTDPEASNSTEAHVDIVKGCGERVCQVDLKTSITFIDGTNNVVVIGKKNKIRVQVSNSKEPAYLPFMNVTADSSITLTPRMLHHRDCEFLDFDGKTSLNCSLANPITKDTLPDFVDIDVEVNENQLMESTNQLRLVVSAAGIGEELTPADNSLERNLQLRVQANFQWIGSSEEEQVLYELSDDGKSIASHNARFSHKYILIKKGPTLLTDVDVVLDIPVTFSDGLEIVKIEAVKTKFYKPCYLPDGTEVPCNDTRILNPADDVSVTTKDSMAQANNLSCSSQAVKCKRMFFGIQDWTDNTEPFQVLLELEVNLKNLAKRISIKDKTDFATMATATFTSLKPHLPFIGKNTKHQEILTQIKPRILESGVVQWWIILLAVLGCFLLLALLGYGLYKTGFFKRKDQERLMTHRALLHSPASGAAGL